MPYIKTAKREELNGGYDMETPGELNYMLTMGLQSYINTHGLSYQTINDIIGALEGAKMEFYRRVAAPYEDKKIIENGDCY